MLSRSAPDQTWERSLTKKRPLRKIFYNPYKYPPRQNWKISCGVQRQEAGTFLEKLNALVAEKGGFSCYYPEPNAHRNVCRFEWNRKHRGDRFGLRVGLSITIEKESIKDIDAYLTTRKLVEDEIGDLTVFPSQLIKRINNEIVEILNNAARADPPEALRDWRCALLIETPYRAGFEADRELANGRFKFLRTRIYQREHKQVTALVVNIKSINKTIARNYAVRDAMIVLALLTLSEKSRYELSALARKQSDAFPFSNVVNENNFYPRRRFCVYEEQTGEGVASRFQILWNAFDGMRTEDQAYYTPPLLAYYGATIKDINSSTLSVIGHMATLASLAKIYKTKCKGELTCSKCGKLPLQHDMTSESKAIAKLIIETCDIIDMTQQKEIQCLVNRVHREQRSAFVHSAKLRHSEYSQSSGVPPASPTNQSATQDIFIYQNDLTSVAMLTRRTLIEWLLKKANMKIDHSMMNINTGLVGFRHDCSMQINASSKYQTIIAMK